MRVKNLDLDNKYISGSPFMYTNELLGIQVLVRSWQGIDGPNTLYQT